MLARNLGQAATYKTLSSDTADFSASAPSATEDIISAHLELLKNMFAIEDVPGWVPAARSPKRVSVKPKHYFADPSLAIAALGMSTKSLMEDWQTFGLVFENLCIRDLSIYAGALDLAADVPVRYYRDDSGLEVDAIVELADGRWAAFEIKTSEVKAANAMQSLRRLRKKLSGSEASRTRPPEFMAVLTGVSEYAWKTEDGIYVIPIRRLGA